MGPAPACPPCVDFWLALRDLASAYDVAGLTPDERNAAIVDAFRGLPFLAQRELLDALYQISLNSPDLYTMARAAANEKIDRILNMKIG